MNDDKKRLEALTKELQDLTEFERRSREANYVVGGKPTLKMNDDKNRDIELLAEEIAVKFHLLGDSDQEDIEEVIRSHLPPQPPIAKDVCPKCGLGDAMVNGVCHHTHRVADVAEDVRELATSMVEILGAASKQEIDRGVELLQSFLTFHTAEQQNIGSRLMVEQIAQSYTTGAGRFSFEKEGDTYWQINKMLNEIDSARELNTRLSEQVEALIVRGNRMQGALETIRDYRVYASPANAVLLLQGMASGALNDLLAGKE